MILRVWVNQEICLAHGLCVDACPQVFEFRGDSPSGGVSVKRDAQAFFSSHANAIYEARSYCPMDAIQIEDAEDDGANHKTEKTE